jgi:hypothetical protein
MNVTVKSSNDLPHSSLINKTKFKIDYLDVHSKTFIAPCRIDVESAVKQFFFSIPKPFLWMLAFREFVGKRIGLKTAGGKHATLIEIETFKGEVGEKIALFEVWDRNEEEILTGQHDKHLDFILSFLLKSKEHQHTLTLLTAVQFNNKSGRIYFKLTKPLHKLLMPVLMKNLSRRLAQGC